MTSIYQAMYKCISVEPIGLPGYNDVVLGLSMGNRTSDIVIKGTCSRFMLGREYLISIMEKP
jgi:hypothetical protein